MCVSSDEIREKYFGKASDQEHNTEVFEIVYKLIVSSLSAGNNVIYDATNIKLKHRISILDKIKNIDSINLKCIIMATTVGECKWRNSIRERFVSEYVIDRMANGFQCPYRFEGWDDIQVIRTHKIDMIKFMYRYSNYDQKNPHHTLTLTQHCDAVADTLHDMKIPYVAFLAGYLHDIGKPFTQTIDENGIAHYYGHAERGSYESLFFTNYVYGYISLEVSALIAYHMMPFNWNNEKVKDKWKKIFGDDFYKKLMWIHEADCKAK